MKKALLTLVVLLFAGNTLAADDALQPKQLQWQFDGALGTFDNQSAQRGYQIYKEVCAACHSMKYVAFRNLTEIGFSVAETKAIAAEYSVVDGPDDVGDMFERPGLPSDRFVSPFPNENAARAANGGAYPPDLSLMTKARPDGPNYVYSLLTGYKDAPSDMELQAGMYYNPYFPGGQIAMAPPLSEGLVSFQDETEATVDQMSRDLVMFLHWAAEPKLEQRKEMGIRVLIFLLISTILFIIAKRRIWADVKK